MYNSKLSSRALFLVRVTLWGILEPTIIIKFKFNIFADIRGITEYHLISTVSLIPIHIWYHDRLEFTCIFQCVTP